MAKSTMIKGPFDTKYKVSIVRHYFLRLFSIILKIETSSLGFALISYQGEGLWHR